MYNSNFHAYNDKYTYTDVIERHRSAGDITDDDVALILKYIDDKLAKGKIKDRRAQRVAVLLTQWRRFIKEPYRELTIDGILAGITAMRKGKNAYGRPYKVNTQSSMIKALKTFAAWLMRKKIINIDMLELDDIKPPSETTDSVSPKDVLTDAQINDIINACPTTRDKALISLLAETGARVGEAASLTWADLEFKELNVSVRIIDVKDKSKWRVGYVVLRKSYLVELRKLQADDKESDFVFRAIDKGHKNAGPEPISYIAVCWMIKRAMKKAGVPLPKGSIGKLFRVSSVTNKLRSGVPTTAIMKTTWGSGLNSRMFKHYEKLADVDTERMLLQASGIEEIPRPTMTADNTAIRCVCGELCAPKAKFCPECGTALTKTAIDVLKEATDQAELLPEYQAILNKFRAELETMQAQNINGVKN